MASDFNKPVVTDTYTAILPSLVTSLQDLARGLEPTLTGTSTNVPTGTVRWNATNIYWERYNGTSWVSLPSSGTNTYAINISGTATTVTTAAQPTITSLGTLTSITSSGSITFAGTGLKLLADFSNATIGSRFSLQSSTPNGPTLVSIIPNGTSTDGSITVFNNSSTVNYSSGNFYANATDIRISADKGGTGSYLPLTFYMSGAEKLRLDISGNLITNTSVTGYWQLPVGTTAQRPTGSAAMLRFNSTLSQFEGHNGTAWGSIGGGATGGGSDTVFQLNKTIVSTSYTLPIGSNAMVVGPLTINSGINITIPTGQRLVIL